MVFSCSCESLSQFLTIYFLPSIDQYSIYCFFVLVWLKSLLIVSHIEPRILTISQLSYFTYKKDFCPLLMWSWPSFNQYLLVSILSGPFCQLEFLKLALIWRFLWFWCCKKRFFGFYQHNWLMQSSLKFNQGLPVNSLLYQNFLTTSFFCIFCQNWCSFS